MVYKRSLFVESWELQANTEIVAWFAVTFFRCFETQFELHLIFTTSNFVFFCRYRQRTHHSWRDNRDKIISITCNKLTVSDRFSEALPDMILPTKVLRGKQWATHKCPTALIRNLDTHCDGVEKISTEFFKASITHFQDPERSNSSESNSNKLWNRVSNGGTEIAY